MPLELTTQSKPETVSPPKRGGLPRWLPQEGVGDRDRMLFTERLALLLETGVSLNQALAALRKQSDK
ncbi:MAG: hypothetical protein OES38_21305, partial [Gammaproteobacteria bacterium]|nr:hypothetical protein [Gammaproteobacteria bacterium]